MIHCKEREDVQRNTPCQISQRNHLLFIYFSCRLQRQIPIDFLGLFFFDCVLEYLLLCKVSNLTHKRPPGHSAVTWPVKIN